MTQNYHTPIVNGDPRKNDAAIWNDPLGELDAQIVSTHAIAAASSAEVTTARGSYADLDSRIDAISISGGAGAFATLDGNTTTVTVTVGTGEADAFTAGAPVAYTLDSGVIEYGTIASASGSTITLDVAPSSQIDGGTLISQISPSEYEAAIAVNYGGTFSATLPRAISILEREVNAKAFGAFGDNTSHVIGALNLAAAQAQFPLTHAAYTITAADEYDWCAIQEAIETASATGSSVERVYIPRGSYMVNRTILVPMNSTDSGRRIVIEGAGARGTPTSGTLITLTANTTLFWIPGLTVIGNMALVGNLYSDTSSIAIRIGAKTSAGDPWEHTNCLHVTLDRIRFNSGWYYGIYSLYECDQLHIIHCSAIGNIGQAMIYLHNDVSANGTSPSANVVVESCHFGHTASTTSGDSRYGVYLMGTEGSVIRNSVIRGYDHTIYLDGASGSRNFGLHINGIHSEINQDLKSYASERWTPNTAYSSGDIIRPMPAAANGWWYKCTGAGTTSANSILNSTYEWTASARGTDEYYLQLASAGGDPSVDEPFGVMENGTAMTFAWAGRLEPGQWGYGRNDSQTANTIYVRLSDSTDPNLKADHYLWTSTDEPDWSTAATYGATVLDGGVTWTAYKRSVFCEASSDSDATVGGLRISSTYLELFSIFVSINTSTSGNVRVAVDNCTVLTTDMVYSTASNIRASFMAENSLFEGSIRPYATLAAGNAQTAVMLRFVKRSNDLVGALGNAENGISTWFTGEINSSYISISLFQPNDADATIDLINHRQIIVSTDSAVNIYVPRITSTAWLNGLLGRQYTIVHGDGAQNMTLVFNTSQLVLHAAGAPSTIAMNDIGDAATICLTFRFGGTARWILAGSYGI